MQYEYGPKNSTRIYLWIILAPIIISLLAMIIYPIVANAMGMDSKEFMKLPAVIYINAGIIEVAFVCIYFIYMKHHKISIINANKLNVGLSFWQLAIICCLALALCFLSMPICNCFEELLKTFGYNIQGLDIKLDNFISIAFTIVFLGVVPAFVEEFIFRGAIMQGFKCYGKWFSILMSALLFMIMHGNIQQTIYQFACGVLFGWLVWETGSIWTSIILHGINNITIIILQALIDSGKISFEETILSWQYVIIAIIDVAILVGLIYLAKFLLNKTKSHSTKSIECIDSNIEHAQKPCDFNSNTICEKQRIVKNKTVFMELIVGITVGIICIIFTLVY